MNTKAPYLSENHFPIEKEIPIPKPKLGRRSINTRPWVLMDVGDSFLVPEGNLHNEMIGANQASHRYSKKFQARQVEGGIRVWRVE